MVVIYMSKYICWFFSIVLLGPPNHLHCLLVQSEVFVLVIDTCEKEGLHTHLTKHRGWRGLMPERINVPGCSWDCSEGLLKPSVADGHLVDDIFVVRSSLIRHAPASIQKLNLTICIKCFHFVSLGFVGLVPPSVQKGNLYNRELVSGIFW